MQIEMSKFAEKPGLTVSVPRDSFTDEALANLYRIVNSKAELLKKAIGTDCLDIVEIDSTVQFPWFPDPTDADEFVAYAKLIGSLCEMARHLKRVTAVERPIESEKYAMRCFLIRLGCTGPENKKSRDVLLRNLSGNAAFPNQEKADAYNDRIRDKRNNDKSVERETV